MSADPGRADEVGIARGKAARKRVPRSSHAEYAPAGDRSDPVAVLERQARSRVPELVPIRYGRMLVSPFAFYRGAAAIMAADLASTPASGIRVQCCGDAHLSNFGVFASRERRLVFDLNDFDETAPGPWEWDVKRLATSILIAARSNGFAAADGQRAVLACVAAYRRSMARFAAQDDLDVWYAQFEVDAVLAAYRSQFTRRSVKRTDRAIARARTKDSMAAFSKLTRVVDGQARIVDRSPLIVPVDRLLGGAALDESRAALQALVGSYRDSLPPERRVLLDRFALADFARKVVGVGSVGTRCWIALLHGRARNEPLFLQVKEAQPSVLEAHVGASDFANHGQRVVVGQRLMQASSDIFLGWLRADWRLAAPRDFYVRQLKDWKGSAEIEQMVPDGLAAYGRACAWTLARAHACSGDRVAIAAYLGGGDVFDRAIVRFAEAYAHQNDRDHAALVAAVRSGRVVAQTGL